MYRFEKLAVRRVTSASSVIIITLIFGYVKRFLTIFIRNLSEISLYRLLYLCLRRKLFR